MFRKILNASKLHFLLPPFLLLTSGHIGQAQSNPLTWSQLATSGGLPTQRKFQTNVYDPISNRLIVFGGCAAGVCQQGQPTLNDVWVLTNADGTSGSSTWIQSNPTGGPPLSRHSHVAVYDPNSNAMTICCGDSLYYSATDLNDVWTLTNANGLDRATGQPATSQWVQLFPAGGSIPYREAAAAVYDTNSNRMIVFGGSDCNPYPCIALNDVWVLTNANGQGGTPEWIQLLPTGAPPLARLEHTVVYDGADDRMILFGGGNGATLNDTWVLIDASGVNRTTGASLTPQWVQFAPAGALPAARGYHAASYNSASNQMIIFGGSSGYGVGAASPTFNDVWMLSNANGTESQIPAWTQVSPVGTPPANRAVFGHMSLYNPSSNTLLTYGGVNDLSPTATTYQDSWVLVVAPVQPILTVAATSTSRPYEAANPLLTYTMSGFVNGDTQASATTGVPSLTTTASSTSLPGPYPITVAAGTLFSAKYLFSFVPGTLNVTQAGSSVTLTSSTPTVYLNSVVTFTAKVTPATSGTPTGTVTFFDGGTQISSVPLSTRATATYSTSGLLAGVHLITASYGGDSNFAGSASPILIETVHANRKYGVGQITLNGLPLANVPVLRLSSLSSSDALSREETAISDADGYYFFTNLLPGDYIMPVSSGTTGQTDDLNQGPHGYIFAPEFCQIAVRNTSRLCAGNETTLTEAFVASLKPAPLTPPIIFELPVPSGSWTLVTEAGGYTTTGGTVDADPSHTDLSSGFYAIDVAGPCGTPILAPAAGIVVFAGPTSIQEGWGNTIVIEHPGNLYTRYAHLHSIAVRKGDSVTHGQELGLMGSTGLSFGPHVHFQFYDGGFAPMNSQASDPLLRQVQIEVGTASLALIDFVSGLTYQSTNNNATRTVSCKK